MVKTKRKIYVRDLNGKKYRAVGLERNNRADAKQDCRRAKRRGAKGARVITLKREKQTVHVAYLYP